jgi:cell division protein FtsW
MNAPDAFGRLLAAGITGWIGLQILVNLGAVTGLLPITGVPLPFLSFGGTALVVTLAGVGVIASVGLEGVRSAERRRARSRSRTGGGGSGR